MGNFFENLSNGYNSVLKGLNEAAFGDVRNIFRGSEFDFLMGKPIGLVANSYEFVARHLRRNIGNTIHHYDGFGTPIGELANPFANSFFSVPWFFMDGYKNSTANYIEYIKAVYGATISVENINESYDIRIIGDGSSVGAVPTSYLLDMINAGDIPLNVSLINPNGVYSDTKLGMDSSYYAGKTLNNAISWNDDRSNRRGNIYGITDELKNYFGFKTKSVLGNHVLDISNHNKGESYLSNGYFQFNMSSPLESTNYGNYDKLGVYEDYYEKLGEDSKYHFKENVFSKSKKYFPYLKSVSTAYTYFDEVGINPGKEVKSVEVKKTDENGNYTVNTEELQIRYIFSSVAKSVHSNIFNTDGGVYVYTEKEGNLSSEISYGSFNPGVKFGTYVSYGNGLTNNDLLRKTNVAFKKGAYDTIIARFHTDSSKIVNETDDTTQTAISKYGLSHGRNLLKREADESQGYDNPYCRTWTFHHQYHRLADAIRPFQERGENGNVMITQEDLYNKYGFNEFSADNSQKGFENGRVRLGKYGVINQHNGLVNITPIDNGDHNKKVDIRNCMFSIENLAWKDSWSSSADEKNTFQNGGLSSEQKGPFGGRIMWFPPYGLTFNETVTVDWGTNNFIGRGESIFTYKNTTRSGQLNFKILIDHPSILNYWENRGRSSSNSVNDVDDPEQQLLRFFAGCEMLTSKRAETKTVDLAIKDEPVIYPNTEVYTFFVFFPNNYSGVDDDPDYAAEYLTNGVGTWATKDNKSYRPSYSECKATAIGGEKYLCGGYEMRASKGISFVRGQNSYDYICTAAYGSQTDVDIVPLKGRGGDEEYDCIWYYRVDNSLVDEDLKRKESYIDFSSNGINSILGKEYVYNTFGIEDNNKLFSFADVFVALTEGNNNSNSILNGLYDNKSKETVKKLLTIDKNKIKGINCIGQASRAGHNESNEKLAKNRANTIANWLRQHTSLNNIASSSVDSQGSVDDVNEMDAKLYRRVRVDIYVSSEESNTAQDVEMDKFKNENNFIHPTEPKYPQGKTTVDPTFIDDAANIYYDSKTLKNKENYMKLSNFAKSVDYLTFNLKNSYDNKTLNVNGVFNAIDNFRQINVASRDLSLNFPGNDRISLDISDSSGKGTDENQHDINNSSVILRDDDTHAERNREIEKIKRYDNESKFFELLEIEEPFMHQKISDKVKYFDPAFHSISPEGFNARLTFLHQCTRQGPTCGASDVNNGSNTANNLAFGRPPVCILRLGDFYYTKIIIKSISIDYSEAMWDLNAEGIGVMPMLANVGISFEYIGGSSLSGPIARLQNAVSFNAYANTEVYDNRAELAEFDDNGNMTKFAPYNPPK